MSKDDDSPLDAGDEPEPPYEVGYRRPPLHTRFGQGNRASKGRPKGSLNLRTIFNEVFAKPKKIKLDGREVRLSRGQIALERQCQSKLAQAAFPG